MSSIWVAAVVIIGMAIGIVKAAIGEMVQEEVSTRLGRIPFALIQLACMQVPPELRDDLAAEWNAELEYLLSDTDGMPLTRLVRGIRYSSGLLISARGITDELTHGNDLRVWRRVRSVTGIVVVAIGCQQVASEITAVGPGFGIAWAVSLSCPPLEFVILGIALVCWRSWYLLCGCGWLLACVCDVSMFMNRTSDFPLVAKALFLCLFLAMPGAWLWELRREQFQRRQQELHRG